MNIEPLVVATVTIAVGIGAMLRKRRRGRSLPRIDDDAFARRLGSDSLDTIGARNLLAFHLGVDPAILLPEIDLVQLDRNLNGPFSVSLGHLVDDLRDRGVDLDGSPLARDRHSVAEVVDWMARNGVAWALGRRASATRFAALRVGRGMLRNGQ